MLFSDQTHLKSFGFQLNICIIYFQIDTSLQLTYVIFELLSLDEHVKAVFLFFNIALSRSQNDENVSYPVFWKKKAQCHKIRIV